MSSRRLPHASITCVSASGSSPGRPGSHRAAGRGTHNVQTGLLHQCAGRTAKVHTGATIACPECSWLTGVQPRSL